MTPKWKIHPRYSCLEKRIRDNISTNSGNRAGKTQAKLENFTNASHFPPRGRDRGYCTTPGTLKKREFNFQETFSPRSPLWYLGPSPHASVFVWKRRFFPPVWPTKNAFFQNRSPGWRFLKALASRLRVDGQKRKFWNTMACSVRDAIRFPLFSVFALTAEIDSNMLRVDAYFFWKQREKVSVVKNIWIRMDGPLNSPLVDAWRKKLLPVTVLDASVVPNCFCSTRLPFYQYQKSSPVLDNCITFKTVQYMEYNINPIKEFELNNNSKLCFYKSICVIREI